MTDTPLNEDLCTVTEAAYLLGRTEKSVYKLVKLNKLSTIKIGGSTRIKRADLQKLVNGGNPQ
jgi:excisionase family DNA binding protein